MFFAGIIRKEGEEKMGNVKEKGGNAKDDGEI
jgi:hypothetical protein